MVDFDYREYLDRECEHHRRKVLGTDDDGHAILGDRQPLEGASPATIAAETITSLIDDAKEYDRVARASADRFDRIRYSTYRRRAFLARQVARYIASNGRVATGHCHRR